MPKKSTTPDHRAAELAAKITAATGKAPRSDDPVYLAQRWKLLEKKKAAGEPLRKKHGTAPISASMPIDARKAFDRIVAKEKRGVSDIVVQALALWARTNGYEAEAVAIGGTP